jgi:hypothetical protein
MSTGHIHVHIGALALRGFNSDQREAITAGLAAALQRQLADPAITAQVTTPRAQRSVSAPPFTIDAHTQPATIGSRAGVAVARSLCT